MKVIQAEDRRALVFVALGYALTVLAVLVLGWRDHRTLSSSDVAWGILVGLLRSGWVHWVCLVLIAAGLVRPRSLLVAFGALALCYYLFIGFLLCSLMVT